MDSKVLYMTRELALSEVLARLVTSVQWHEIEIHRLFAEIARHTQAVQTINEQAQAAVASSLKGNS